MTIAEQVLEMLKQLPVEKQRELLEFAEKLGEPAAPAAHPKTIFGALSHLGVHVTREDIAEIRREMWGQFPREVTRQD